MINKPLNPETIKRLMKFPHSSKFLGYIIYFFENDEFLHHFKENEIMENSGYCRTPGLAIVYSKFSQAQAVSKKIKKYKSFISMLFEDDKQHYVAQNVSEYEENIIQL